MNVMQVGGLSTATAELPTAVLINTIMFVLLARKLRAGVS